MAATCEVTRIGPVTFRAPALNQPFLPEDVLTSRIGGSSCVVAVSGPLFNPDRGVTFDTPGFWQGLYGLLYGKLGSFWVPIRNGNLPVGNFTGSRQWLNYEGAEYSGFQFRAVLTRSNFDPTQWPTICKDLHLEMIVGAGAGALPPGSGSMLQQQVGPVPVGNDLPTVGASPERRRLLVEIVSLAPGATAGIGWGPADVTPASWYPLQVGRQYAFATTAAAWLAVDPPGAAASFVVSEESGLQKESADPARPALGTPREARLMQKRTAQRAESQPLRRRQCGAPTGSGPCIVWMIDDERRDCAVAAPLPRRLSAQDRTLPLFLDEPPAPAVDLFNAARRLKPSTLAGRRTPPEVETPPRTSGDEPKSFQLRMAIAPPARHTWSPLLLVRDSLWRQSCAVCSLVRQVDASGRRVRTWFVLPDGVSIDVCPSCVDDGPSRGA